MNSSRDEGPCLLFPPQSSADGVKFCRLIGIIINDRLYYGMKAVRRDKVRAVIYGMGTKRE